MLEPDARTDEVARQVVDAAIEVHRHLGPGLLENHYKDALAHELRLRGLDVRREVPVPVYYKGHHLGRRYSIDMLAEDVVVVEAKATDGLHDVHFAQTLSYLRCSGLQVGFLLNFNERLMKDGIMRIANTRDVSRP